MWGLVLLPYFLVFSIFLFDPTDYARTRGIASAGLLEWLGRAGEHFLLNFSPWQWVDPRRGLDGASQAAPPGVSEIAAAALGTVLVLWLLHRSRLSRGPSEVAAVPYRAMGVLLAMTVAVNAMYALVQLSQHDHRTHLLSRVWASILLALVATALPALRLPGGRAGRVSVHVGSLLVGVFVFLGLLGGSERQRHYREIWVRQRHELRSIVEAVPAPEARAVLILRVPPRTHAVATANTYIARHWASLVYEKREHDLLFSLSHRGGGCRPEGTALLCWDERRRDCIAAGECAGTRVPLERALVLTYSQSVGAYSLDEELPPELAPGGSAHALYRPRRLTTAGSISPFARKLLCPDRSLPGWLPAIHPRACLGRDLEETYLP
jgi:hypothetical protein